ncbi:unnamed protein product [Gordionus sp. m RMFG-2023]|uniref:thimet oligopeptidase-like n=1 Tax=Gordionus sp. m RMFG-2023 TaxID=3053472 RepID=UPI0030DEEE52
MANIKWNLTSEDLVKESEAMMAETKILYDKVGHMDKDKVSIDNLLQPLSDNECEYDSAQNIICFFQHVSPDKDLRKTSCDVEHKFSDFDVEMSMRQDIFDNIVALDKKLANKDNMEHEMKRYLDRLIKIGKRNGLHLSKDKQDELKIIKKRMNELCIDFSQNLNEDVTILEYTKEELDGLPDDFLECLEQTDSGKYKVTLKYPHYNPIMKKAKNPETRKTMEIAFNSRCLKTNLPILEELITLRQREASILGFPNHVSYVTELRMAKNYETVRDFLARLVEQLRPAYDTEFKTLKDFKAKELKAMGKPVPDPLTIDNWDLRYYANMVEEENYAVDHQKVKQYFPLNKVTAGLFNIYQILLGLKFNKVGEATSVWQQDVETYSVKDAKTDELIGYFYLDLYPRDGKYAHAACFGLKPSCLLPAQAGKDGKRQLAVAAMVANFTRGCNTSGDGPTSPLLTHDEVTTYFHEFGHVMHDLCAQSRLAHFSGTSVERDFVETPSQMLENWCWEAESLKLMSGHHKDGSPIPEDLLQKLIKSRKANIAIMTMRQLYLATFDHLIHTKAGKVDILSILDTVSKDIMKIPVTQGTNMAASFGHLAGGYDGQYYSYMWSERFCMDMFESRFLKEGIMNPKTGMDYRMDILHKGGSEDAVDMLKKFLGREPSDDAFLHFLGIKTKH